MQEHRNAVVVLNYEMGQKYLVNCCNPRHNGKELKDKNPSGWLYKIGDYRLISHVEAETITTLALQAGHRKNYA